jgi:uncharacterized membrane protein YbhN (UPF0104 family)
LPGGSSGVEARRDAVAPTHGETGLPVRVDLRPLLRRAATGAALAAAALGVYLLAGGSVDVLADALLRAVQADWRWVAAGALFEVASFAAYVALFRAVLSPRVARLDVTTSAAITFAGAAVTRLLPTAGLGGAGLTTWAVHRAGLTLREAVERLVAFLVVLYAVYMVALVVAGGGLALGLLPGQAPRGLAVPAAALAAAAILAALLCARRVGPRPSDGASGARWRRWPGEVLPTVATGTRRALAAVRTGDPRLAGAVGWWAFDVAVLWATLQAFGAPPPLAAAVLAYFAGSLANLLPLPGAVATGMVGVHVAVGVPLEVAVPGVLAYRAVALWLPAAGGLVGLAVLRRRARAWAEEDRVDAIPAGGSPVPDRATAVGDRRAA